MKTLLKIDNIRGDVCSAALDCKTEQEYDRLAATILSLMEKDSAFAKKVLQYAALYIIHNREMSELVRMAEESARKKTQN